MTTSKTKTRTGQIKDKNHDKAKTKNKTTPKTKTTAGQIRNYNGDKTKN